MSAKTLSASVSEKKAGAGVSQSQRTSQAQRFESTYDRVLDLQRTLGNRMMRRLLVDDPVQETRLPRPGIDLADMKTSSPALGKTGSGAGTGLLQRQPAPHITEIRVNQTTSQQVTATWSDGHTDSGECSTGKGHCCFDDSAGTAEGGACSAARSVQEGNNCTPVGTFTVTYQTPKTGGGVELWTQFHDAKSVALHDYDPYVNGTPLSHGCVRLHRPLAQTIYDGSRIGVTRVVVENLARPRCTDAALIAEWEGDFRDAGRIPPDGTQINPDTGNRYTTGEISRARRHIRETRREMRSALGVDNAGLDAELATIQSGTPAASRIPRCVPAQTVEEQQVPSAQAAGFLNASVATTATAFETALRRTRNRTRAERVIRQQGTDLWATATAAARGGGSGSDDRQIYWTRLMFSNAIRQWNPSWASNADELRRLHVQLLQILEETSRGRADVAFPSVPDEKRILISGFDPFGFTNSGDIQQSNLSGAGALALDGATLSNGTISAHVEGVVFPVRFADFNAGVVESFFSPFMNGSQPVHLIMTISQGDSQFELEEYAGRRRSAGVYHDNLGTEGGGTQYHPVVPPGLGTGPEFIPTNVPAAMLGSMRGALGRTSAITEETQVMDLPPATSPGTPPAPRTLPGGPGSSPGLAVEGSGGGFLSNEIFYRNSLLRTQLGATVPVIHLHTPRLVPGAADTVRNNLIDTIRQILVSALSQL